MKKKLLFFATLLAVIFIGYRFSNGYAHNSKEEAAISEVSLASGTMTVYDYGTVKLHVYNQVRH